MFRIRTLALCGVAAISLSVASAAMAQDTPEEIYGQIKACEILKDPKAYEEAKQVGSKVLIVGKDGWLFRTRSDLMMDFEFHEKRIKQLVEIQKALEAKGTKLYIAYLPNRGIVEADLIDMALPEAKDFDAGKAKQSYDDAAKALRAAGVRFLTMDTVTNPASFFRKTDQHWTSAGARQYAQYVAGEIKKDPVYANIKKTEFESTEKGPYYLEGSLSETVDKMCGVKMPKEQDVEFTTAPKQSDDGEGALFGDAPTPEIVLVGTSNSKAARSLTNFDGFLKEYLSADVLNNAISGGGVDDPMIAYLQSKEFHKTPPKILIWEIPAYYPMTSEGGRFLDELLPAVKGACANPVVTFKDLKVGTGEMPLLTGLEGKGALGRKHYLRMEFSKPVEKNFSVFFKYKDSDEAKYRFKRTKRYPFDGIYTVLLPDKEANGKGKATLTAIELAPDKKMADLTVSGQVCPVE